MWIYCLYQYSPGCGSRIQYHVAPPQTVISPTSTEPSHTTTIYTLYLLVVSHAARSYGPSSYRLSLQSSQRLTTSPRTVQTTSWLEQPPTIHSSTRFSRAFSPSRLLAPSCALVSFHGAIFATDAGWSGQTTRSLYPFLKTGSRRRMHLKFPPAVPAGRVAFPHHQSIRLMARGELKVNHWFDQERRTVLGGISFLVSRKGRPVSLFP
jgi:hypothetical protein